MADPSLIGRSTQIRGSLRGTGAIELLGKVEGDVSTDGDVLVGDTGEVLGDVTGANVRIEGIVAGNILGSASVLLGAAARVVGDLRAPVVGIADGALYRGAVESEGSAAPAVKDWTARRHQPAGTASRGTAREPSRTQARPAPAARKAEEPARPVLRGMGAREPGTSTRDTAGRDTAGGSAAARDDAPADKEPARPVAARVESSVAARPAGVIASRPALASPRWEAPPRTAAAPVPAPASAASAAAPVAQAPAALSAPKPAPQQAVAPKLAPARQPPPPVVPVLVRGTRGRKKKAGAR